MTESTTGGDLGMLLAACCERMVRGIFAKLGPAGYGHLTPSQTITVLLVGWGTDTVTQIADRLGMTPQGVSKICSVLYGEGLLDRESHSEDARSRRLTLTTEGQRVLALLGQAGEEAERAWADLVGADTLETVRTALAAYAQSPNPAPQSVPVHIRFA